MADEGGYAVQVLISAKQHMAEILMAFEFFDKQALDLTMRVLPEVKAPLEDTSPAFYALIETAGSNKQHDREKVQASSVNMICPG